MYTPLRVWYKGAITTAMLLKQQGRDITVVTGQIVLAPAYAASACIECAWQPTGATWDALTELTHSSLKVIKNTFIYIIIIYAYNALFVVVS